jgi:hypothetical protein
VHVRASLKGKAASVKIVHLLDLPVKGDVSDFLASGRTVEDLERLVADTPEMQEPEPEPSADLGIWDAGEDDYQIEPRGWLLGNIFCRKFLSSLIADGGVGKTALRIAQLLSLAIGRSLTGEHIFLRCRVLIVSFEDDRDELRRRVKAALMKYGVRPDEVKGWLFLAAPKCLKLAKMAEGEPQVAELEGVLRTAIKQHNIDIVSLDPFVKTHGLEENSNGAIDFVCGLLATIAIDTNCAIDMPHHTNKGLAPAGDANKGRGASAMKDALRLVYTLTPMSPEEAQMFGLDEGQRRSLIRLDSGKVNIAPPSSDATWFQLVGIPLDNATEAYPAGDHVQTVERWHPPDTMAGLDSRLLNRILDDIEAGMADGQRYSGANAAGKRAAWLAVQAAAPNKTEKQCRAVIVTWLKSGTLITEEYEDPIQRRTRSGLRVAIAKRPS